jgi:thiol peroxidase
MISEKLRRRLDREQRRPSPLLGRLVEVGDAAPDFQAVTARCETVDFAALDMMPCVVCALRSLDIEEDDRFARCLIASAKGRGRGLRYVLVTMDLPYALRRWGDRDTPGNVLLLSDHRDASFATEYGLLNRDTRLLARALFGIDASGRIVHRQVARLSARPMDCDRAVEETLQAAH